METNAVETSRWVIWGSGEPLPTGFFDVETSPDAALLARAHDPEWAKDPGGWAVIVSGDEHVVRAWVQDNASARGFGPQMPVTNAEPDKLETPRPY